MITEYQSIPTPVLADAPSLFQIDPPECNADRVDVPLPDYGDNLGVWLTKYQDTLHATEHGWDCAEEWAAWYVEMIRLESVGNDATGDALEVQS